MADTLDLLSLADGYAAINNAKATGHDDELAGWITAVSRRIDQLCGPVVERTVTGEQHDGGCTSVVLDVLHASAASSVVEYDKTDATTLSAETNAVKTGDDYLLDDIGGGMVLLRRRANGCDHRFPVGRRNVVVTYTAGRYADTASVDPLFATAAESILRRLWAREAGAWAKGPNPFDAEPTGSRFFKAVDPMVKELLADELRGPVYA